MIMIIGISPELKRKFKTIFISGDGASGIKNYKNCFPNAKFVLDKFHYIKKHLNYIFKYDSDLKNIADDYIRNDKIDDFKKLVDIQISKYLPQEKYMKEHINAIIDLIGRDSCCLDAEIGG